MPASFGRDAGALGQGHAVVDCGDPGDRVGVGEEARAGHVGCRPLGERGGSSRPGEAEGRGLGPKLGLSRPQCPRGPRGPHRRGSGAGAFSSVLSVSARAVAFPSVAVDPPTGLPSACPSVSGPPFRLVCVRPRQASFVWAQVDPTSLLAQAFPPRFPPVCFYVSGDPILFVSGLPSFLCLLTLPSSDFLHISCSLFL